MKVFHIIAYSQESDKLWFQDSFKCVSNEKTCYAAIHACPSPSNTLCVQHIEVRKSTTFEDCDVQKIWCFTNITIYFDTPWLLNRLMNSVGISFEWVQMKM